MENLVVVGAGGFGREILDVVDAVNAASHDQLWNVIGVVDDAISDTNLALLEARSIPHLGESDAYLAESGKARYVVGVGSPVSRRAIADKFDAAGHRAASLVHPTASRGFGVRVGEGTVICAGVRLTTNIIVGRHVHLNLNGTVGHDTVIGDFVSANPLASISGDCVIEPEVMIGVAGVVLNKLTVGRGAVVGGSACVVKDVPPGAVAKGVPGKW